MRVALLWPLLLLAFAMVPGLAVASLQSDYTPDSNISSIGDLLDSTLEQGLGYDRVGRLVEAAGLYGLLGYGYDANGNRTALTVDGQSQSYNIRASNNWLLKVGGVTNTYDTNGNLVGRGGDSFVYDSFNRLTDQRDGERHHGHLRLQLPQPAGLEDPERPYPAAGVRSGR